MKNLLMASAVFLSMTCSVSAQLPEMTPAEAQEVINEKFLTEETVKITTPLKRHTDYVAENYSPAELKGLIRNAEEIERKSAARLEQDYVPYDRQIDVKKPQQVKRYFRSRLKTIY